MTVFALPSLDHMSETVPPAHDLLGTLPSEQDRLLHLNRLLNPTCLTRVRALGGEKILDVGSGLGLFARDMARAAGSQVVCVERDPQQIERCQELAAESRETALLDVRIGDARDLPLRDAEWGTFDIVHARFVLQHVPDPQRAVAAMARAVRPGGRVIVADEDHDTLRLWPSLPAFDELWRAFVQAFRSVGNDAFVGRRLPSLLALADLQLRHAESLSYGGCTGDPHWEVVVDNLIGTLFNTRADVLLSSALGEDLFDEVLIHVREWSERSGAAIWSQICWAEALRGSEDRR